MSYIMILLTFGGAFSLSTNIITGFATKEDCERAASSIEWKNKGLDDEGYRVRFKATCIATDLPVAK